MLPLPGLPVPLPAPASWKESNNARIARSNDSLRVKGVVSPGAHQAPPLDEEQKRQPLSLRRFQSACAIW
jgi:hypothetical protein